jgi:hypothetical protein
LKRKGTRLEGCAVMERRLYSAVHGFWPVEELADKPTGCGEVSRGGCLFAWNFSVIRSAVLTEVERRTD